MGAIWAATVISTPFTPFGDLEGWATVGAVAGLLIAGTGAIGAVFAVSTVLEPEDTSFGEFKHRLGSQKPVWWRWLKRIRYRHSDEHLKRAVKAEERILYGGAGKALEDVLTDLDKSEKALHRARRAKATAETEEERKRKEGALEATQLDHDRVEARYLRLLVLSGGVEMRAKFFIARLALVLGALLVLFGVVLYFSVVSSEDDDDQPAATGAPSPARLAPVAISLQPDRADGLNRLAGAGCITQEGLTGYAIGDPTGDGPWTLVVIGSGACQTIQFRLEKEDGRISPAPPETPEAAGEG